MDAVSRFVFTHRRSLAALLAGLAVWFGLAALTPDGAPVVVARHDLASGATLRASDLDTVRLPRSAVPETAVGSSTRWVGRTVAGPMRAGEPLTDRRVLDPRDLSDYGVEGRAVMTTISVADPAALTGVAVGDSVDVVSSKPDSEPAVIARSARVAAIRESADEFTSSVALTLVTSENAALSITAAATSTSLSVLVSPTARP